jgi:hypothetical protein
MKEFTSLIIILLLFGCSSWNQLALENSDSILTNEFRNGVNKTSRVHIMQVARHIPPVNFESADNDFIRELISNIELKDPDEFERVNDVYIPVCCECLGDYIIEFWEDDQLLTKITIHHFQSLLNHESSDSKWDGGHWSGNIDLTDDSSKYLKELINKTP